MRAKSLQDNAPGETRTPNLLIRSQFSGFGFKGSTRQSAQGSDEELPKTDNGFHNNSHNVVLPHVLDRTPVHLLYLVRGFA